MQCLYYDCEEPVNNMYLGPTDTVKAYRGPLPDFNRALPRHRQELKGQALIPVTKDVPTGLLVNCTFNGVHKRSTKCNTP
jgi:hypothetical protein